MPIVAAIGPIAIEFAPAESLICGRSSDGSGELIVMARIREPAPPPTTLVMGRYRLAESIGAGAFGTVWRAIDEHLGREVAIKAIPAELAGERAEREIKAAARLSHPGVVTLHEASADATHTYIVSEFVRGPTLAQLYSQGTCSDRDVARIGAALAGALDHAHAHGVVHRDVKPGNILIPDAPRSEAGIVKLADFGIARLAGESSLTRTGDVVGTLAYMAPEQAAGEDAGPSADLWALALIVHEGFSGSNPVRGATPAQTARNLSEGPPESLAESRPDLPEWLVDAVDAALEHDPDDRGLLADLGRALGQATAQLDDEPGSVAPAIRRRERTFTIRRRSSQQAQPEFPHHGVIDPQPFDAGTEVSGEPLGGAGWESSNRRAQARNWQRRLVAGLGAAAMVLGWSLTLATVAEAREKWLIAAIVFAVVAALPRLGFIACGVGVVAAQAAAGEAGAAVVLLAALAPAWILSIALWQWAAFPWLAPLMGSVGFAGAWPALASLAGSAFARAALGALGAWQLGCAEMIFGKSFLGQPLPSTTALWADSPSAALSDAVGTILSGPIPAVAGVWALGAVLLPIAVRGQSVVADALAAAVWAVGLGAATAAFTGGATKGVFAGTLAGGALAVIAGGWGRPVASSQGGALHTS